MWEVTRAVLALPNRPRDCGFCDHHKPIYEEPWISPLARFMLLGNA